MPVESVGTVLASTAYVWYGKISAKLKTSRGAGVVTAFILLSDDKDEIDFEFVGTQLTTAQTNYYSQGVTNYNNGGNISLSDTFASYHTYEIDWTPDQITWSIDGQVGRTKKRSETWNATSNRFDYPQTPSRIQLSIWPGGLATNGKGTIDWAGGPIDWNSGDVATAGYFYAGVTEVSVQCYDPPASAGSGKTSYVYTNLAGTNDTISLTDKPTVLKSLLGTGTNMTADFPSPVSVASGSKSSTGSAPAASISELAVVPGLSGAGPGVDGQRGGSNGGSSSADSASSTTTAASGSGSGSGSGTGGSSGGSGGSGSGSSAAPTGTGGFAQGSSSTGSGTQGSSAPGNNERVLQGSLFAGLIAVIGMLIL
ncbi:MAG: hypothetical protein M1829_003441 [Trizodia sp. TS-e1964]|nr:MAG: hypothetical protein M1829_003441 [Trizodia sp. TS-e1964]